MRRDIDGPLTRRKLTILEGAIGTYPFDAIVMESGLARAEDGPTGPGIFIVSGLSGANPIRHRCEAKF